MERPRRSLTEERTMRMKSISLTTLLAAGTAATDTHEHESPPLPESELEPRR